MFNISDLNTLNELEYAIYNYVVNNKKEVINMKINDLANTLHVSTSSIVRFCKKLNFEGFSELKLYLKQDTKNRKNVNYKPSEIINFLNLSQKNDFEQNLNRVADIITNSSIVFSFGYQNSQIPADYLISLFNKKGKFSVYSNNISNFSMSLKDKNICLVVFSVSGETHETIEYTNTLKRLGVKIIAITNHASTLSKLADASITYNMTIDPLNPSLHLVSYVPIFYIIEALANKIN